MRKEEAQRILYRIALENQYFTGLIDGITKDRLSEWFRDMADALEELDPLPTAVSTPTPLPAIVSGAEIVAKQVEKQVPVQRDEPITEIPQPEPKAPVVEHPLLGLSVIDQLKKLPKLTREQLQSAITLRLVGTTVARAIDRRLNPGKRGRPNKDAKPEPVVTPEPPTPKAPPLPEPTERPATEEPRFLEDYLFEFGSPFDDIDIDGMNLTEKKEKEILAWCHASWPCFMAEGRLHDNVIEAAPQAFKDALLKARELWSEDGEQPKNEEAYNV